MVLWTVTLDFCTVAVTLNDGKMCATDVMIVGKYASACGYGEDCTSSVLECFLAHVTPSAPFRRA